MKKNKVTVLMPVYNGEKYLREAVDSILNQTYTNFDFLIINDGSTDNTLKILQSYNDNRIKIIDNKENLGLIQTLNKGLRLASGEFIARMDADDISLPVRLEKQINYLIKQNEVGVLGSQADIINDLGEKIDFYMVPNSHNMIAWMLLFGRSFIHPSVMFRRSAIEEAEGYNASSLYMEDYELWISLVKKTRFANLSETLIKYRTSKDSISRRMVDQQQQNVLTAKKKFIEEILNKEINIEILKRMRIIQSRKIFLSKSQGVEIINLITSLYYEFKKKQIITGNINDVFKEVLNKMVLVSCCVKKEKNRISAQDLAMSTLKFWNVKIKKIIKKIISNQFFFGRVGGSKKEKKDGKKV